MFEDKQLTYKELNERANQLAHYLQKQCVDADKLVALCVERSLELIIALLAILKLGRAYVPLDVDYPKERIDYMLKDSKAGLLLTQSSLVHSLPTISDSPVIMLDVLQDELTQEETVPILTSSYHHKI